MTTTDPTTGLVTQTASISDEVVLAVAEATDTDPTELEPLYDVVDPDALDQLFQPHLNGTQRIGGRVIFSMDGCEVTIHANGDVVATPLDDRGDIGSD